MYSDAISSTPNPQQTLRKHSSISPERLIEEKREALIDEELSERSGFEIAAAYQSLCGALLAQTLSALSRRSIRLKDQIVDKRVKREWIAGTRSIISFREMCDALSIDPERTAESIWEHAENPSGSPINRTVMGVLQNAD
jgi:hypothetical protein